MGVLTDYFVATPAQLAEAFAGWETIMPEPVMQEAKNPFTGESRVVAHWVAGPTLGDAEPSDTPNLDGLPALHLKRLEHVALSRLNEVISPGRFDETLHELAKPALKHPSNEETGLHLVPASVVNTLASIEMKQLPSIAERWQQSEEMTAAGFRIDDVHLILQALTELSQYALAQRAGLYLLWSL